jgi:PAS domain S-box-containing protein
VEGLGVGILAHRILAGEKAGDIGILPPNPARLIVDERQMKRWGIKSVPAGTEVRYHEPTLWEQHRVAVVATSLVLVLQFLLIAGLIVAQARQKRAEKELRSSEARFAGVFRGSPAAISIVSQANGRLLDVNPGWEKITGVSRADAIGRTPLEIGLGIGMAVGDDSSARFRQLLDSGKPLHDYEQVLRMPDGRTRWLSVSSVLVTLQDESYYIMVAKDVTEHREAEEARRQLAQTSRVALLGEITASIAHEVNQPLGAILSNTDAAIILMQPASPPLDDVRQILADIRRDNLRAGAVIERVRALVGHRETQHVPLDLNTVLLGTLKLVAHDARRRGVGLSHDLAGDLPLVHADAAQLEQVLLNLLLNAMDAMKDTPIASRQIILRSSRQGADAIEAVVEDRGHGIPPDQLGRIFDSFVTTKERGMGLGLALARSIAEAHGGNLYATNNPAGGATFHLVLPITLPVPDDGAPS